MLRCPWSGRMYHNLQHICSEVATPKVVVRVRFGCFTFLMPSAPGLALGDTIVPVPVPVCTTVKRRQRSPTSLSKIKILKDEKKKAAEDPKSGLFTALPGHWVDGKLMHHVQRTSAPGAAVQIRFWAVPVVSGFNIQESKNLKQASKSPSPRL